MNMIDWKKRLQDLTAAEEQQTGCRIHLEFERKLLGWAGRIAYHNPANRTLTVNLHCFLPEYLPGRQGDSSVRNASLYAEYCFQYIAAMLRLDKPADEGGADSYQEGLAILWHRMKKDVDHAVDLKCIRTGRTKLSLKPCWSPGELFCDVTALQKTMEICKEAGMPPGFESTAKEREAEARLLISMPEICYPKKKRPYLAVPYLLQKIREKGQSNILEGMLVCGGLFAEGMLLRMASCGAENLAGSGFSFRKDDLCAAADTYRQQAVTWLRESADSSSRMVKDNRIGVERTVSQLNEWVKNNAGPGNSGTVHPFGYY